MTDLEEHVKDLLRRDRSHKFLQNRDWDVADVMAVIRPYLDHDIVIDLTQDEIVLGSILENGWK